MKKISLMTLAMLAPLTVLAQISFTIDGEVDLPADIGIAEIPVIVRAMDEDAALVKGTKALQSITNSIAKIKGIVSIAVKRRPVTEANARGGSFEDADDPFAAAAPVSDLTDDTVYVQSNIITAKFSPNKRTSEALSELAKSQARVKTIDIRYSVKDEMSAWKSAVREALSNAKAKAACLSALSDLELGGLIELEEVRTYREWHDPFASKTSTRGHMSSSDPGHVMAKVTFKVKYKTTTKPSKTLDATGE